MSDTEIRWKQRFVNFTKALGELEEAVELSRERSLSKLEKQGLIQLFGYTYELAWQVMEDFFYIREIRKYGVPGMLHGKPLKTG